MSSDDETDNNSGAQSTNVSRSNSTISKRSTSTASLKTQANDDAKPETDFDDKNVEKAHQLEVSSRGKIKGPLFFHYINSAGMPIGSFILFILFLLAQILASAADFWVAYWSVSKEFSFYKITK